MAAQPSRTPTPGDATGPPARLRLVLRAGDHRPLNPRTLAGGLLVAASAVGLYVAASPDDAEVGDPVVVAATDLRPGRPIESGQVRVERARLPEGASAFAAPEDVVGRMVLGPVGAGEVVQPAAVSADAAAEPLREVALSLPREQVAVGRLRVGDRVDVYVTADEATSAVVHGVPVVALSTGDDDVLGSGRDVRIVVAVGSPAAVADLVHALRTGDVTLVRSTHATEAPGDLHPDTGDDGDGGDGDEGGDGTGSRAPSGGGR